MRPTVRLSLDNARVVTARELSRDTASVIAVVVQKGEPAVITKHGRLVAVLVSLASFGESALLGSRAAQPFLGALGAHDLDGVAQGLTVREALGSVGGAEGSAVRDESTRPTGQVTTVRRLNQETSAVLNQVRDSGRPVFISRYGSLLVALLPVTPGIESELLGSVAARAFAEALGTGLHDGVARGLTADEVCAQVNLDIYED